MLTISAMVFQMHLHLPSSASTSAEALHLRWDSPPTDEQNTRMSPPGTVNSRKRKTAQNPNVSSTLGKGVWNESESLTKNWRCLSTLDSSSVAVPVWLVGVLNNCVILTLLNCCTTLTVVTLHTYNIRFCNNIVHREL